MYIGVPLLFSRCTMKKVFLTLLVLLTVLAAVPMAGAEEVLEAELLPQDALIFQNGSFEGSQSGTVVLLSANEEEAYDLILQGLRQRAESIDLSACGFTFDDVQVIFELFSRIVNDNPELFYVTGGFNLTVNSQGILVYPTYIDDLATDEVVNAFNAKVDAIIADTVVDGMSDLEKALVLHDWLVDNIAYNWAVATTGDSSTEPRYIYSTYGALMAGDAVCQGYALAYQLLLSEVGIDAGIVSSDAMNHAWNWVLLDGEYYHVDVTWDDPTPNRYGFGRYDFFLRSDETMMDESHGHYDWDAFAPECSDHEYEDDDYAFNRTILKLHRDENGSYYTISADLTGYDHVHYGPLDNDEFECLEVLGYNVVSGLWREGRFYFVQLTGRWADPVTVVWTYAVKMFDPADGSVVALTEDLPYEQMPSPCGFYPKNYDHFGLRLSTDGTALEVVSSTRREVLTTVQLLDCPTEWIRSAGEFDGEGSELLGLHMEEDGSAKVGALVGDNADKIECVWAAFYKNGKMVGIRQVILSEASANGLVVCDVDMAKLPAWDSYTLMMVDSLFTPMCAAVSPE